MGGKVAGEGGVGCTLRWSSRLSVLAEVLARWKALQRGPGHVRQAGDGRAGSAACGPAAALLQLPPMARRQASSCAHGLLWQHAGGLQACALLTCCCWEALPPPPMASAAPGASADHELDCIGSRWRREVLRAPEEP